MFHHSLPFFLFLSSISLSVWAMPFPSFFRSNQNTSWFGLILTQSTLFSILNSSTTCIVFTNGSSRDPSFALGQVQTSPLILSELLDDPLLLFYLKTEALSPLTHLCVALPLCSASSPLVDAPRHLIPSPHAQTASSNCSLMPHFQFHIIYLHYKWKRPWPTNLCYSHASSLSSSSKHNSSLNFHDSINIFHL